MSRTKRLLDLLLILNNRRYSTSGHILANELGVSIRTLYRDIAILRSQGAQIEGEAGIGYVLKPSFFIPPMMFTENEVYSLVLGARWVSQYGDISLSNSAKTALDKIFSVLPHEIKNIIDIVYLSSNKDQFQQSIWPFALGYFTDKRILVGWCEKQCKYIHFETSRIISATITGEYYSKPRAELFNEWQQIQLNSNN